MLESIIRLAGPGIPSGWRAAGLALAAGVVFSAASPLPAAAQQGPSSWRESCTFKTVPQGNGDSLRYANCMRQMECQRLANATGRTIFEAGCFGVSPELHAGTARP